MPVYKSDAIILRTYKLGESDRIVVFLTRDRGKKRGVAKGARRPRSRFMGSLEPMTLGGVAYFEKETRELVSLNYVETLRSPLSATTSDALGHVAYFAELIDEWSPEGDPNERVFRLGAALIEALTAGVPIDPLARYFEYWLLRIQGVYPTELKLSPPAQGFLQLASSLSPDRLGEMTLAPGAGRELEAVHRELITTHLEKELKSSRVLRQM